MNKILLAVALAPATLIPGMAQAQSAPAPTTVGLRSNLGTNFWPTRSHLCWFWTTKTLGELLITIPSGGRL